MAKRRAYVRTKYSLRKAWRFTKQHPVAVLLFAAVIAAVLIIGSGTENNSEMPAGTVMPVTPSPQIVEMQDGLYVHYIDVGQGDCELVVCDGEYMLIDAGWYENGDDVVRYLKNYGIERLEYVVCTHGDADHCGGLEAVIESFEVGEVFVSPYCESKESYGIFLDVLSRVGLEAVCPDMSVSYPLGSATVKFLGPTVNSGDSNENSLVLRVDYGKTGFLFTGDIQYLGEQALFDSGAALKCDVLKVAHHGSYTSTGYHFLYEAMPQLAVISCGKNNSYGHPHDEVLSRLHDADVTVYRTDLEGTVIISSDGESVERITA